ncbi:MAG: iron-containing alcohol dehydrogenase [Lentihominibacter sp.]
MNKIFCRLFQAAMKLGMYFLPWTTPEIIQGQGTSAEIAEDMKTRGIDRALVVMGPNMMKRGLPLPMLQRMKEAGIEYSVFDSLTSDPTDLQVEAGVRAYRQLTGDMSCSSDTGAAIVLFGGGSPMDCGKAIAARIARPDRSVAQLQGVLKVHSRKRVPFIYAVPTTAGTGSEATMAAVITDHETHRKKSINDISIIPHVCVLDASLTTGLSPEITADTGMDALCHAVEAYTNSTYNTVKENKMAEKAVKLIYDNLYSAFRDGSDIEARQGMQMAAFYAGRAFTRGCVGYVHAVGHAVGGLYGIPHGRAMAILLPHMMKAYGTAAEKKLARLADVCFGQIPGKTGEHDKSGHFISWMEDLNRKMGIPEGFDCIREEDIPTIAKWADAEANPLYPVPVIYSRGELEKLVKSACMQQSGSS